jgi:hypothetical protein
MINRNQNQLKYPLMTQLEELAFKLLSPAFPTLRRMKLTVIFGGEVGEHQFRSLDSNSLVAFVSTSESQREIEIHGSHKLAFPTLEIPIAHLILPNYR